MGGLEAWGEKEAVPQAAGCYSTITTLCISSVYNVFSRNEQHSRTLRISSVYYVFQAISKEVNLSSMSATAISFLKELDLYAIPLIW